MRPSSAGRTKKAPWMLTSSAELTTNVEWSPQACDYRAGLEHGSTTKSKALPSAPAAVSPQYSRTGFLLTLHHCLPISCSISTHRLFGMEVVNINSWRTKLSYWFFSLFLSHSQAMLNQFSQTSQTLMNQMLTSLRGHSQISYQETEMTGTDWWDCQRKLLA